MYNFRKDPQTGKTIFRKDFESERSYLEALYEIHHAVIDKEFGIDAKEKFIKRATGFKTLRDSKGRKLANINRALKRLGNSGGLYEMGLTNLSNVIEGLKGAGKYEDFLKLVRDEKGRFMKLDVSKFSKTKDTYYYAAPTRKIAIQFYDSPFNANVWEV